LKRLTIKVFLLLYSSFVLSSEVNVPAGEMTSRVLNNSSGGVALSIAKLHDTDPMFSPVTQLIFYKEDGQIGLSVGILKADDEREIVSYYQVGGLNSDKPMNVIKTKLKINTDYSLKYFYSKKGRLILDVTEKLFALEVGFDASRVEHMISGMKLVNISSYE